MRAIPCYHLTHMPTVTKRDEIIRMRWKAFLTPLVGRGRLVTVSKLGAKLAELTDRDGDLRADVYAYLDGRQTVSADRAFFVGEALRECGITWSSGYAGLLGAGRFADAAGVLGHLASSGVGGAEAAAMTFGLATPLVDFLADRGATDRGGLTIDGHARATEFVRNRLAYATSSASAVSAFETWTRQRERGLDDEIAEAVKIFDISSNSLGQTAGLAMIASWLLKRFPKNASHILPPPLAEFMLGAFVEREPKSDISGPFAAIEQSAKSTAYAEMLAAMFDLSAAAGPALSTLPSKTARRKH